MSISQILLLIFLIFLTTTFSGAFLLNEHANASVGHPDSDNYNIYSKIDALERSLQNLETTVREKTTHSDTLMRQVLLTVNEMDTKIESSDLHHMTLEIEKIKTFIKNSSENLVGFTTKLTSRMYDYDTIHIQGNPIVYNQGSAYNGTVFTCSSPGLYLIQVSVMTLSVNNGIWIYKNLQTLTLAWSSNAKDSHYASASTSVATWLDTGDYVYLRPYHSHLKVDGNSAFTAVKIN